MNRTAVVACACLLLSACITESEPKPPAAPQTARGAELLEPFKKDLKQALMAGMTQGPLHAVTVCKDQAPAIAKSLSVDGVAMGRTSHRLRNPANTAPEWADKVLRRYVQENGERNPVVVPLARNRVGYVEPILLQPLCATCHGKSLAPELAAHLQKAYPEDRATGFDVGDLRGVFWVEYPR
jgi:hypothetical protein